MKKILLLLILSLLILTGCSSIANYSVRYIDVNSVDDNVKKWIDNNSRTNGIYLGKTNQPDDGIIYCLYVNYPYREVSIEPRGKDTLIINARPIQSDRKNENEVVFYITVKDTSVKKFILNGEDIKISAISVIN